MAFIHRTAAQICLPSEGNPSHPKFEHSREGKPPDQLMGELLVFPPEYELY